MNLWRGGKSFDFSIKIKLPSAYASEWLYKNSNDDDNFTYNLDCNFYEDIDVEIVQRPMQMVFDRNSDKFIIGDSVQEIYDDPTHGDFFLAMLGVPLVLQWQIGESFDHQVFNAYKMSFSVKFDRSLDEATITVFGTEFTEWYDTCVQF